MILTIKLEGSHARDLLLFTGHHPDQVFKQDFSHREITVFYPKVSDQLIEMAILMDFKSPHFEEVDYLGKGMPINQFINQRPWSFNLSSSSALAELFSKKDALEPEILNQTYSTKTVIHSISLQNGKEILPQILKPLGYKVEIENQPGKDILQLKFSGKKSLPELLKDMEMLAALLDDEKNYYLNHNQLQILATTANKWIPKHPDVSLISQLFNQNNNKVFNLQVARLSYCENLTDKTEANLTKEKDLLLPYNIKELEVNLIHHLLVSNQIKKVAVLECGKGALLEKLLSDSQFEEILGLESNQSVLQQAGKNLGKLNYRAERISAITLGISNSLFRDKRLSQYQAVVMDSSFSKLPAFGLKALQENLFEAIHPDCIVISCANKEYNRQIEGMDSIQFRNPDHEFEWTRKEFSLWAKKVAGKYNYSFEIHFPGKPNPQSGTASQVAIFQHNSQL